MPDDKIIIVLITTPADDSAVKIARLLVENRLAACVSLTPRIKSLFWWEGKVQQATECLLIVKTCRSRFEELRSLVLKNHPYQVPEIIAWEVTEGHQAYLDWVVESVKRQ